MTVGSSYPYQFLDQFSVLIEEVIVLLHAEIERVRVDVAGEVLTELEDLAVNGSPLRVVPGLMSDWSPDTRRSRYPTTDEVLVPIFDLPTPDAAPMTTDGA